MKIILAEHRGFCYGVTRAVSLAEQSVTNTPPICTLGPIIHNPQMVEHLKKNGVGKVESLDEMHGGTIVIRSHGVGPEVYRAAEEKGLTIIDATCPHVKKAQKEAQILLESNDYVVIVGEKKHPEVKSIFEWTDQKAHVIETTEEAESLPQAEKIGVVSQTTLAGSDFEKITDVLATKCAQLEIKRTICTATELRQQAAVKLAQEVDIMIVIGGKNSANTSRLAELCAKAGCTTKHIEIADELEEEWFWGVHTAGITAGASTPGWIIEEVANKMESMENFTEFDLKKGNMIETEVVSVAKDGIYVDIGLKSEVFIPAEEVVRPVQADLKTVVKTGDMIKLIIEDVQGRTAGKIKLSKRKADEILLRKQQREEQRLAAKKQKEEMTRAWNKVEELVNQGVTVKGMILEEIKGGLRTDICGARGFIPGSQIALRHTKNLKQFIGQEMEFAIIEFDKANHRLVLSRRVILEKEAADMEEQLFNSLKVGMTVEGTVRRIQSYGAFVDIGGIDALLHVSDMAWEKINHAQDMFKVGDTVKAVIVKVNKDEKRVGLSLKKLIRDPWLDKADAFKENQVVVGTVVKMGDFGAFVKIADGVEGLVRVNDITERRIKKAEEALTIGQEVKVKILTIDKRAKKIALGIRQVQQDAERAEYQAYLSKQDEASVTHGDQFGDLLKQFKL